MINVFFSFFCSLLCLNNGNNNHLQRKVKESRLFPAKVHLLISTIEAPNFGKTGTSDVNSMTQRF